MASMNTKKFTILLVLFCWSLVILHALPGDRTYEKMVSTYGKLTSWQADLIQTNYFKQTKTSLKSTGTIYFQTSRLAIRYAKPNEQALVITGGKLTMYDKTNNTVLKSSLDSAVQSLNPVEIVKSYWQKSARVVLKDSKRFTTLQLKPKADKQAKVIEFTVDNLTGLITALSYTDPAGNSVSFAFSNLKSNHKIPAKVFQLTYPKTAQIFEQ
jgi:outer membrane lipoprotein-sorting protein